MKKEFRHALLAALLFLTSTTFSVAHAEKNLVIVGGDGNTVDSQVGEEYKLGVATGSTEAGKLSALVLGKGNEIKKPSHIIGDNNEVESDLDFIVGNGNKITDKDNFDNFVFGTNNTLNSKHSAAVGVGNEITGQLVFNMGISNKSTGGFLSTNGFYNENYGVKSVVQGYKNYNLSFGSVIIGGENNFQFNKPDELGNPVVPSGDFSVLVGNSNASAAPYGYAFGMGNFIEGLVGTTVGSRSISSGYRNSVLGGYKSVILNEQSDVFDAVTIGSYARTQTSESVALGAYSDVNRAELAMGYDPVTGNLVNLMEMKEEPFEVLQRKTVAVLQAKAAIRDIDIEADQVKLAHDTGQLPQEIYEQLCHQEAQQMQAAEQALGNAASELNQSGVPVWVSTLAPVSVGNEESALTRQITGVAAGTFDADAVNVAQLKRAVQKGDQQYRALNAKIDHTESRMRKFSNANAASALATANIPQVYAPGKNAVGVGLGNMNGQSAVAVGISTINDKGDWIFKGTATVNSEGQGFGGGVSYVW